MSLFDIRPWIIKKNDGTKKQVMPQTTIKGVIGLEKELASIKAAVENLTEKNSYKEKVDTGAKGDKGDNITQYYAQYYATQALSDLKEATQNNVF